MDHGARIDLETGTVPCDRAIMRHFMDKPGFLLGRIDQICTAVFSQSQAGVTLNQAEFLLLLNRLGPMIQINLARAAGVDKSTTAYVLDNLQTNGLISRTVPEGNRRASLISLTDAGQAILPHVSQVFAGLQQMLEAPFGAQDRAWLVATLRRLGLNREDMAPAWQAACDPLTGVLDRSTSFLTRRALQLLNAQFHMLTKGLALTPRQFSLLFILSKRQWITQTEFATMFGLDPATCGVIMRGVARRGLVAGARSPQDRRALVYRLTEAGQAALADVQKLMDRSADLVFRHESGSDRAQLVTCLHRLVVTHSGVLRYPGLTS